MSELTIAVVQFAPEPTLAQNVEKFARLIGQANAQGCRVVVFPESALYSRPDIPRAEIDEAVNSICRTAGKNGVYVIFGLVYMLADPIEYQNRLVVAGPDGRVIQTYDKLWGHPWFPNVPGLFMIDETPCCAILCADRWIRGVEELPVFAGAQIIFECSYNYEVEWVPDLAWYWYVPRALRNGAYVVFANGKRAQADEGLVAGHGHSAVIAPDGTLLLAAGEEVDKLFITTIDLAKATRAEATRRHQHPCFRRFWDLGLEIMAGTAVQAPSFEPLASPQLDITIAAAQIACSRDIQANLERMGRLIEQARSGAADAVVFPALAVTGAMDQDIRGAGRGMMDTALARLQDMARQAGLYILFGMPHVAEDGPPYNSAYAVSPQGALLTRYDQLVLDRPDLFAPGLSTRSMWFEVKGVPAVVTIGRDALWSELAELAAVRGALLHFHLDFVNDASPESRLLRRQLWVNLATFRTFAATVNAATPGSGMDASAPASGGSVLWQDFYWEKVGPQGGPRRWAARPLAEAGTGEQVIFARQSMPQFNSRFSQVPGLTNPQMRAWFVAGVQAIHE